MTSSADAPQPTGTGWPAAAGPPPIWTFEAPVVPGPSWPKEIAVVLVNGLVIAALGIPLGLLWGHLAPRAHAVSSTSGALYTDVDQLERVVGAEVWYVLGTGALGLIFALSSWYLWRRYRGPLMLLGLALGSLGSSYLIYRFGRNVGRGTAERLSRPADTTVEFQMPVDLRIQHHGRWLGVVPYVSGVLIVMAVVATLIYLVLAGFSAYPSLRPTPAPIPPWYQPADAGSPFAISSDSADASPIHPPVPAPHAPGEATPPRD